MAVEIPRWEKFKALFAMSIFRYLVLWFSLVPVVYALLKGLPTPLPFELGDDEYHIELGLPFNWQLLWLSSLFYLIALFAYLIHCPRFVRQYNTYSDYQSVGHDPRWLAWEAKNLVTAKFGVDKFVGRLVTKGFLKPISEEEFDPANNPNVEEEVTTYSFGNNGSYWSLSMPVFRESTILEGSERGIFWEIYGRYSESRLATRTFIFGCLVVSGVIFLFVLLQHIFTGGQTVFAWLSQLAAS